MRKSVIAKLALSALLAVGASSFAAPSVALVPTGLTQQGRLLDNTGAPQSGELTFVFSVYADLTGGTALWTETQPITLDDGYFSARLGDDGSNPFPADLFDGSVRYLGIKVGSDPEMNPRQRIASVPYAFMANNAVGDITPKSVTVNGVNVIDSSGNLHGFSSIVQKPTATGTTTNWSASASYSAVTASCPVNHVVVGGGCTVNGTSNYAFLKESEPSGQGWACWVGSDPDRSVQNITATATAICLPN